MKKIILIINLIMLSIFIVSCNSTPGNNYPHPNDDNPGGNTPITNNDIDIVSLSLNYGEYELVVGESVKLITSYLPNDATNTNISWVSSNPSIAIVSSTGLVSALKAGKVIISATTENEIVATCEIIVSDKVIDVTSVSLNLIEINLKIGSKTTLIATVLPTNATNQDVTWKSSNNLVATVEDGVVEAISKGTATITATAGDCSATALVTVLEDDGTIQVENVTLNVEVLSLKLNDEFNLEAIVSPAEATNQEVNFKSTNVDVATVSSEGLIKAVGAGSTIITASCSNGVYATCNVTVTSEEINTSSFSFTTSDGTYSVKNGVYTITSAGTYDLAGELVDGMIYVDAGDDDVIEINLNGVTMSSSVNSIFYFVNADKVEISAKNGTTNTLTDTRVDVNEDDGTNGSAVIFSQVDLKLKGKGTLVITTTYNNGIHTKDDLDIKNLTLEVTCVNNALKGNDSVTIESGNLTLISKGGDGIKTTNSDKS